MDSVWSRRAERNRDYFYSPVCGLIDVYKRQVQSLLAVGLLVAGGLKPLQTISLAAAFPFIFIMLFAGAALVKALMKEK